MSVFGAKLMPRRRDSEYMAPEYNLVAEDV